MKLINSSYEIMDNIDGNEILKKLELCGRVCYKSEHHIGTNTANDFIDKKIVQGGRGHLSVIEHCNITVRIITDRGVSHELVRHRLASYSQESTRYCNYSKKAFNNEITLIKPTWFDKDVSVYNNYDINLNKNLSAQELIWLNTMIDVECAYFDLLSSGITPQNARSVLPNSLKTEIIITANLREGRHIFKERTSKRAHPQIREIMCPLLDDFKRQIPVIFNDITY